MIEQVLTTALDPDTSVTPAQLQDLMEMFISDLHLRKARGSFWMATLPMCVEGIRLAAQVTAEAKLSLAEGLTDGPKKVLGTAIQLSLQEISALRVKLMVQLALLKQCPREGARIH